MSGARRRSRKLIGYVAVCVAAGFTGFAGMPAWAQTTVFINEIHYDNAGTDIGEAIEIAGPAGTDLSGWSLVLYNGNGGAPYNTIALTESIPCQDEDGFGAVFVSLPTNGLQNGSPDGIALVNGGSVIQFLSYEGSFTAAGGPANGMTSTDIGVSESFSTAVGDSLQLTGTGAAAEDFAWAPSMPNTFGAPNTGQEFTGGTPCSATVTDPVINEFVFNHTGFDSHEFVELFGDPLTDYSAFTVVEVEGDGSAAGRVDDGTFALATTDGDGFGFSGFRQNVFENGTVTLLLVENFTGGVEDDLDTDNDGSIDVVLWERVVDCVAVEDGGSSDRTYCGTVLARGFDGVSFTVGGASRIPNATDTDSASDWIRNDFSGEGLPGFSGSAVLGEAFNTPEDFNAAVPPELVINEILQNPAAVFDSDGEWFEVFNPTSDPIDMNGWMIMDNDFDMHQIDNGGPLFVPAGSFLVLGTNADSGSNGGVSVDYQYADVFLANSFDELVLVDTNLSEVDRVEWDNGATFPDPNGASMSLIHPALDNNSGGSWCEAFSPFGDGDSGTPGAANDCVVSAVEIFDIQGAGTSSPFEGGVAATEDNVVTAVGAGGFFMQTPTGRSDGDPDTSDGIFVFTGGDPGVSVGDSVDVLGEVAEFFGLTEFSNGPLVTVDGTGTVPAAVSFDGFTPSSDPSSPSCDVIGGPSDPLNPAHNFECFEGMLVEIADGTVNGPNQRFSSDTVAEVHIVAGPDRALREPGIEFPGIVPFPVWDGNPEVFELDPDKLGLPNQLIPAGSSFSATGVLGFEFGGYELWPTQLAFEPAPLPVPVRPRDPGELTVGSLNLFRLFDDIDDPPDEEGRDDTVVPTDVYERRLDKLCSYINEVLDAPDILAVQEAESLEVLQDLADRLADDPECGAFVGYTPHLLEGNDFTTIDVGFLVRDRIQVDSLIQIDKELTFIDPTEGDEDIVHDRPPLLLEGSCQLEFGSFPIAVMVVHNRSLSSIDDAGRGPFVRRKRYEQAQSIALKVQELQAADPGLRLLVVGDFNAFEFTDGYVDTVGIIKGDYDPTQSLVCTEVSCPADLVEPDLSNLALGLPAEERYSFIFRGSGQVLDHALTSQGLADELSGAEYGRGNADAAFDLINDDGSVVPENLPLRSSDHDGLVVYIVKDEDDDGVPNDQDVCPGTVVPEGVPTDRLLRGRWALTDADGVFDNPKERLFGFTLGDTAGCSCEQIIEGLMLGHGHERFGCSTSAMNTWVDLVNP